MINWALKYLPRRSVLKAITGAVMIFGTLILLALGYHSIGIFFIAPMVAGAFLMKEYFRELGFNS